MSNGCVWSDMDDAQCHSLGHKSAQGRIEVLTEPFERSWVQRGWEWEVKVNGS